MRLVYKNSGNEVKVGDVVPDFRGELQKVISFREPHKPSSSGKVSVKTPLPPVGDGPAFSDEREYFVSVINAEWIEREDR